MPFPGSPRDQQLVTVNGITYQFVTTKNAWVRYKSTTANTIVTDFANITSNTASTGTTTGALRVTGGAGVTGNVFAGAVYTNSYFYANGATLSGGVGFTGSAGESGSRSFSVTNSGASDYVIDGSNDPTLNLLRGFTYKFNVSATGHPFWIKTSSVTGTGSAYSNGVTNNGIDSGTITFAVPYDAPSTLYYICQFHSVMAGTINITDVGPTGFTGSAGAGFTGSSGGVGFTGSAGAGFTGSAGSTGFTGSVGSQGAIGYTGSAGTGGGGSGNGYTGSQGLPGTLASGVVVDTFTSNGSVTSFTLSVAPVGIEATIVAIDGILQERSSYSVSGYTLTLSEPLITGEVLEVTILTYGTTNFVTRTYTGNGVATAYTVTNGVTANSIIVTENGVVQAPVADYTISGPTLTFTTAPANGVAISIRELPAGAVGYTGSIGSAGIVSANTAPADTTVLWHDETTSGGTGYTGSSGAVGFTGSVGAGFTGSAGTVGFTGSGGSDNARVTGYSLIFGG